MKRRSFASLTQFALAFAPLAMAASAFGASVYVSDTSGDFLSYDTLTGSFTVLGNNGTDLYGQGYSSGGTLYADDSIAAPNNGFLLG